MAVQALKKVDVIRIDYGSSFSPPREREVSLLWHAAVRMDSDPAVCVKVGDLLDWYAVADRARSFSSFARIFRFFGPHGHISANLIPASVADAIEAQGDKLVPYDLDVCRPLNDDELVRANRGDGSTLLVTSFFWERTQSWLELMNVRDALEHLCRWFEGNTIESFCIPIREEVEHIFAPILSSCDPSMYRTTDFGGGTRLIRFYQPWRPKGLALPWIFRLLRQEWREPEAILSKKDKLIGRCFHEYNFRIREAIECCIPNWDLPPDDVTSGHGSSSANQWRQRVGELLGVNPNQSRRADTMKKIQSEIEWNPRILTLW